MRHTNSLSPVTFTCPVTLFASVLLGLNAVLLRSDAAAQSAKEKLVGTWLLVSNYTNAPMVADSKR